MRVGIGIGFVALHFKWHAPVDLHDVSPGRGGGDESIHVGDCAGRDFEVQVGHKNRCAKMQSPNGRLAHT
jgi:hypothetical protein